MSRIRGTNTKPELIMEKYLQENYIEYKKYPGLFGKPDFLIYKKYVLFVDGCFWHGCRKHYREPRSNVDFWKAKLKRNIARRKEVRGKLQKLGYLIIEIWEHEIKDGTYKAKIQRGIHSNFPVRGMWRLVFGIQARRVQGTAGC